MLSQAMQKRQDPYSGPRAAQGGSGLVSITILIEKLQVGGLERPRADRGQFLGQF